MAARNDDGIWTETAGTFAFTVKPFAWQTWWFRLIMLILATGTFGGFIRYAWFWRLRLKKLEQRTALDRERARIARDIHDDFGGRLTEVELLIAIGKHIYEKLHVHSRTEDAAKYFAQE